MIQEQIAELSRIIGVPAEEIRVDNPRWLQLLQEGVVVRLTLRRWRARTTLDLQQDLGLPAENGQAEVFRELVDLGRKFLLPRRLVAALDSVDSAARQNLRRYGFETFWGVFVPVTAFPAWQEADKEYQTRYFALRDEVVQYYDRLIAEHMAQFAEAARAAWRRWHALHGTEDEDFGLREDEFVARYLARLRALIPPAEEIYASFAYEVYLSYIPLPSLLAAEVHDAAWITASREAEQMVRNTEASLRTYWAAAEADVQHYRRNAIEMVRQEVLASAQREKEKLIDGFLVDVARQLRGLVYDTVVSAYETTARNGRVHPRTAVQLRNLVQEVQRLNFFGDQEVDRMVEKIRSLIEVPTQDRSTTQIQAALQDVALVLKASLLALGDQQRGQRSEAGLTAEIALPELHRARRSLGLEVEIQPAPATRRQRLL